MPWDSALPLLGTKDTLVEDMAKTDSRTSKSIKNSSVALVFYFINLILQFFSRKLFLDYLGAEVLGLNTTISPTPSSAACAAMGVPAPPMPIRTIFFPLASTPCSSNDFMKP